jgi:hypothetical protein
VLDLEHQPRLRQRQLGAEEVLVQRSDAAGVEAIEQANGGDDVFHAATVAPVVDGVN